MDKEQFKIRITEQFRNVASPIRALMLARDVYTANDTGEDVYMAEEDFYATDFDLMFHVEYVQPDAKRPNEPVFQVQFAELDPGLNMQSVIAKRDLCAWHMKKRVWAQEYVVLSDKGIEFRLRRFSLKETDYLYEYNNLEEILLAVFDVHSGEFTTVGDLWQFQSEIKKNLNEETDYIEYLFTPHESESLTKYLRRKKVKNPLRANIYNGFASCSYDDNGTILSQIMENLYGFRDGEVYMP